MPAILRKSCIARNPGTVGSLIISLRNIRIYITILKKNPSRVAKILIVLEITQVQKLRQDILIKYYQSYRLTGPVGLCMDA
jgi:hypothetical protein